uniref:Rhodopsin domain-containing protein n=1 Tax=Gibberella zeae TaxID=5518 RepID=A0A4E9EEJ9_GIBZA
MDNSRYFSESNISSVLIIPHAVLSVIATVFIVLRVWTSRYITKTPSTVDEWVSIAVLLINHALLISEGVCVHYGYGQNIIKVMKEYGGPSDFLRTFIACEITYGLSCAVSKIAVLTMYYRIFSTSRLLRYSTWVMSAMIASWGVAVVFVSIFSCNPIRGFWDKTIASRCIDTNKFYVGITIPNIMFDFATVALPVCEVWKLQMRREKKWAITSIFLLGGSVVLASIARLVLFLIYQTSQNPTQTIIFGHLASSSEVCLAIIGACLPSCAPLLKQWLQRFVSTVQDDSNSTSDKGNKATLVTIGQKRSRGHVSVNAKRDNDQGSFERLNDNGSFQGSTDGLYTDGARSPIGNGKSGAWNQVHIRSSFYCLFFEFSKSPSYSFLNIMYSCRFIAVATLIGSYVASPCKPHASFSTTTIATFSTIEATLTTDTTDSWNAIETTTVFADTTTIGTHEASTWSTEVLTFESTTTVEPTINTAAIETTTTVEPTATTETTKNVELTTTTTAVDAPTPLATFTLKVSNSV